MKYFKGFDKDLKCRGFQYEPGKLYEEEEAKLCENGFHACERPLDVLAYYPPGMGARYCEVDLEDVSPERYDDTKVAARKIRVGAELGVPGLCRAQFEYVKAHTTMEHTDPKQATAGNFGAATAGDRGAATAGNFGAATAGDSGAATAGARGAATAGDRGAATAGDMGAATAGASGVATAGDRGAATAGARGAATAGDRGAATAGARGAATAGDRGAATAGDRGAATAGASGAATAGARGAATAGDSGAATSRGSVTVGKNGCGLVRGDIVKIRGGLGAILVICLENATDYDIKEWKAVTVDGVDIKADTWYTLQDGELVEVTDDA